jgi:hypothetical protein
LFWYLLRKIKSLFYRGFFIYKKIWIVIFIFKEL